MGQQYSDLSIVLGMASSLLFIPPPCPLKRRSHPFPIKPPPPTFNSNRKPYFSSPRSPSSAPEEDSASSSIILDDPQFRGCKTCGKEEIEKGCNGEGRIQGGIATVPGFGWWPIKAFRPCPGFVASGGRYKRRGQSMDEVAFGRGGRDVAGS